MSFEMPKIPGAVPIPQQKPQGGDGQPKPPPVVSQGPPSGAPVLQTQNKGGFKMQLQSKGLFNLGTGMAVAFALFAGAAQWAKYDLLSNSLSYFPAIFSNSTATMNPATGLILSIIIDLIQKASWSGINWRDGLQKKEIFYLIVVGLLFIAEVMGVAMPVVIPDISGLPMQDLGWIFWARLGYQLTNGGILIAFGGVGIILALTILPEFLHDETEKTIGSSTAWGLFAFGFVVARLIFSAYTGNPVVPSINWF